MRVGPVVLVSLLGALFALALDSTEPRFDKSFPTTPLSEQVLRIDVPEEDTSVAISNTIPPPPTIKRDIVVWDESTMPHPDGAAKMPDGPDLAFAPLMHSEPVSHETNVHTTHRNMVMPGLDMIRVDKTPDITQNPSFTTMQSVTEKLEALYSTEMPVSAGLSAGSECSDAAAVAEIGTTPVFSETPILPTQEIFGTAVSSNSYNDFISGLPKDLLPSAHDGVALTPPNPSDRLNPQPILNVTVTEGHIDMAFKFTVRFRFMCEKDISSEFEGRYGKILREATSLGAHVPLGNVEIDSALDAQGIIRLDIGAPSVEEMRAEITSLKEYLREGTFKEALKLKGFPNCASSIVSIADNLQDVSLMPEATTQDQLGPPGGQEEDPLTIEEQRERIRVREAMTYGEYVRPGRLNITRLQPHIFHNISLHPAPQLYNVMGRFKFIFQSESQIKLFPVIYSGLVQRGLAHATNLPMGKVQVQVSGAHPPFPPHVTVSFLELSSETGELPYVILDFDIGTETLIAARSIASEIVKSVSNTKGIRDFLRSTGNFPEEGEMTLLFIEIHSPDGQVVDEESSCSDEQVDDEVDVQPSPEPITPRDMQNPADCKDAPVIHATPDQSVQTVRPPAPSSNEWKVITTQGQDNAFMNKPGMDGRDPIDPSFLLQAQQPAQANKFKHAQQLGMTELVQLGHPQTTPSMHDQSATALVAKDELGDNAGMPEADDSGNTPAGGFPVPDSD